MPGKERKRARHKLRTLLRGAGAVRDCDITLQFLGPPNQNKSLRARCEVERRGAAALLAKSLRRWVEHDAQSLAPEKLADSVEETAEQVLPRVARECLKRGVAAAEGASPEQLHRFRISAKKLRYTVELFASRDARSLRAWLDQIKKVQTLLGDINDCEAARHLVGRLGGGKKLDAQLKREQARRGKIFHQHWTDDLAQQWKRQARSQAKLRA